MVTHSKDISGYTDPEAEQAINEVQDNVLTIKTTLGLLRKPLYNVPELYRKQVLDSAMAIMQSNFSENKDKMLAAKVILEADKRDLEAIKLIIPKTHVHVSVKDQTTGDLEQILIQAQDLIPADRRIIDAKQS